MHLMGILIELRGEGAAIAGIYRHTWRSRASSIFVLHAPYKVTDPIESACENLFMESSREVAEIVPKVACGSYA